MPGEVAYDSRATLFRPPPPPPWTTAASDPRAQHVRQGASRSSLHRPSPRPRRHTPPIPLTLLHTPISQPRPTPVRTPAPPTTSTSGASPSRTARPATGTSPWRTTGSGSTRRTSPRPPLRPWTSKAALRTAAWAGRSLSSAQTGRKSTPATDSGTTANTPRSWAMPIHPVRLPLLLFSDILPIPRPTPLRPCAATGNAPNREQLRRGKSLLGREEDVHESGLTRFKRGTLRRKKSTAASTAVDAPKSRGCFDDIGPGPKDAWFIYSYIATCWIPSFLLNACGEFLPVAIFVASPLSLA